MTKTETAGITRANEGMQGITWSILGQTYVPKTVTEDSFSWHAIFPPGTVIADAAEKLLEELNQRLGYTQKSAAE